jgi:protein-tyrosine phosphatase
LSNNYIKEIINNHKSKGMIEDSTCVTIIDDCLVKYNKYNLKLKRINGSSFNTNYYNSKIITELKKDSELYKEIREFNLLFRFFNKLNIKNGYIRKIERPDFEFTLGGTSYGIEVTRLYTGNDWVAEKIHNEIVAFNLTNKFPNDITYKRLDLRDEPDQPIIEKMKEAYDFIKENKDHNIFVHCMFGKSRSGSVVIFYVMNELKMDFNSARDYVKNKRDIVDPNEGFKNELNKYYEQYILPLKKESEKEKEAEKENVKESEKQKEMENENMNKINIQ